MAARKTKASSASPSRAKKTRAPVRAPAPEDVPVTCAMLTGVKQELIERIGAAKEELRAELKAEIQGVRAELKAEIQGVRAELMTEIQKLDARLTRVEGAIHELRADIRELKAEVARIGVLVEEQNARNKVVLDGLMAFIDRQGRLEHRVDKLEDAVRRFAPLPA